MTPWTAAHQASLSVTISWSLLRLMSIKSMVPSNHLILCCPLLLPSILPSIRVFPSVSSLHQVAKVLEFQFQHQSFNEYSGLISFRMDCLTPNPTFHTRGPPISSEPPSVTSWLNHTKNLQEDFLPPPSPPAASSQHSRQYDPATTHQITSLFCPKPSHHPPPSSH